jgi:hypothetical protein
MSFASVRIVIFVPVLNAVMYSTCATSVQNSFVKAVKLNVCRVIQIFCAVLVLRCFKDYAVNVQTYASAVANRWRITD